MNPSFNPNYNPNPHVVSSSPMYINNNNNPYPPHQYMQQYPNQYQQQFSNQIQPNSNQQLQIVWEKKFLIVHQRFQWEFQKFQALRQQYQELCQQLNTVDSQEDWNQLKAHHAQLMEKFNEMQDQLAAILNQNNQLASDQNLQYQSVWQQRYHQLLDNFKALQQEMEEIQQGQTQKQNYDERRQEELANQYRQLQVQYSNALNDLKAYQQKDPQSSQIHQYRERLDFALQECEKYKSILDKQHQENQVMQREMARLQQQNNALRRDLGSKTKFNQEQYQHLLAVTQQKQQQLSQSRMEKQMTFRQNKKLNEQLQLQMQQIQHLREMANRNRPNQESVTNSISGQFNRLIQMKTQEISEYKSMLRSAQEDFKVSLKDQQEALIKKYQEKINSLKKENKRLESRLTETQDSKPLINAKIESLEKKVAYYQKEVNNLNETLVKKNDELMQLRSLSFEIQKAKNLKKNYESLQKQRDQQKNTIKLKSKDIDQLKNNIYQLQTKLRQFSSKKADFSVKFLQEQIQSLKQNITRKQNENNRNRQLIQSKQNEVSEARSQMQKYRAKLNAEQKNYIQQKQQLDFQIQNLNNKIKDYEKKMRHLQFQYGNQMKSNLQSQISILRGQNQTKQETINRMEAQTLDLRSRVVNLQRQKGQIQSDNNQLRGKINEFQRWKTDYHKKMEQSQLDITNRDKQIQQMQLSQISLKGQFNSFKDQVTDHQQVLKNKNIIIRKLQMQNQMLGKEIDVLNKQKDDLRKNIKKITQQSRQEIFKLQQNMKLGTPQIGSSLYLSKTKSMADFEGNSHLKMMNALKSQNQRLKMELARLFNIDYQNIGTASKGGQGLDYIQKRLQQFNSKLTGIIFAQEQQQQLKSSNLISSNSRVIRVQGGAQSIQNNNTQSNFKLLKEKIVNLQKYCASLQIKLGNNQVIEQNPMSAQIIAKHQTQLTQQIQFYKSKAEDFQKRGDHLLVVNNQLKQRVQYLLNDKNEFSSANYYKQQALLAEKNNQLLLRKIQKLSQDNRSLRRANAEIHSKELFQKQGQIDQLNTKIQQLSRKIRQLQLQKVSFGNQKASLSHQIRKQENQFKMVKNTLEDKISQYENHTSFLSNKVNSYELQIKEMNVKGSPSKEYANSSSPKKIQKKIVVIQSPAKPLKNSTLLRDVQSIL